MILFPIGRFLRFKSPLHLCKSSCLTTGRENRFSNTLLILGLWAGLAESEDERWYEVASSSSSVSIVGRHHSLFIIVFRDNIYT